MSEPIGMSLEIGGVLPAALLPDLIGAIEGQITDIVGDSVEEILTSTTNSPARIDGISNYGMCDDAKEFCKEHNLSFIHNSGAKDEYEASTSYWLPGMKCEVEFKTDASFNPVITPGEIKPYLDLLLEYAEKGDEVLPLQLGNDSLDEDFVAAFLKKPKNFLRLIKRKFDSILPPEEPTLPPLIISYKE